MFLVSNWYVKTIRIKKKSKSIHKEDDEGELLEQKVHRQNPKASKT